MYICYIIVEKEKRDGIRGGEENKSIKIGDVYLMNFNGDDCEQQGWRPGLVFQNNVGNQHSPNIIALPLTTAIKKRSQPTHVFLPASETGLRFDSIVLCENPERMSKNRIDRYLTTIPDKYMAEIAAASLLASSAISYLTPETLMSVWKEALSLNTA